VNERTNERTNGQINERTNDRFEIFHHTMQAKTDTVPHKTKLE